MQLVPLRNGNRSGDGSKDPTVATVINFSATIHREHPPALDFEAFNHLLMQYVSLFEPAFVIWASLVGLYGYCHYTPGCHWIGYMEHTGGVSN
jgi:hypothetical protein